MAIFEEGPDELEEDPGLEAPPAPWEYEPELPPEIEQGEDRPVPDADDYEEPPQPKVPPEDKYGPPPQIPSDEPGRPWPQGPAYPGERPYPEPPPPKKPVDPNDWTQSERALQEKWIPQTNPGPLPPPYSTYYGPAGEQYGFFQQQPGIPESMFQQGKGWTPSPQFHVTTTFTPGGYSETTTNPSDSMTPQPKQVIGPKMPAQPSDRKLTQTDVPWYDPKSGQWIYPDSVIPGVNSPMGRTSPTGPAAPEGLWASVQSLWRTLMDPRYARGQAFGGYVDPSGGQWANRDRWPTSPGDFIEGASKAAAQANRVTFGPPLNPETAKAIERVIQLGAWVDKNRGMSERAETYQAYVTGTIGQEFKYNDVEFDGFNGNALLDAKDHYEQFVDEDTGDWKWFFTGGDKMVEKARGQVEAAQGAPIEWHFNEKAPADRVRKLFSDEGIKGIEVIYDPMPADWGK